jgi:hypothetical protein
VARFFFHADLGKAFDLIDFARLKILSLQQ